MSIAAGLLLVFVLIWYLRPGKSDERNGLVAQKLESNPAPATQKELKDEHIAPPEAATATATKVDTVATGQQQVAESETPAAPANAKEADRKLADNALDYKKSRGEAGAAGGPALPMAAMQQKLNDNKKDVGSKKETGAGKEQLANAKKAATSDKTALNRDDRRSATETVASLKQDEVSKAKTAADAQVHTFAQAAPSTASRSEQPMTTQAAGSAEKEPSDKLDKGKYYFDKQKWGEALNEYKGEINNSSKPKRHQATFMAAQCYLKLGNNKEAERLLKIIVDEGGAQKRHAKKLLESLQEKPKP